MSRFHFIKLASPSDARRFESYLKKPGAKLLVNAKSNVKADPFKQHGRIDNGNLSYTPHDNRWGWIDGDHMHYLPTLEATYRNNPQLMLAIAVPVQ